jgi:multidrug resistance efflux pump
MKEILVKERDEAEKKRKDLEEELALIDKHLEEQQNKQERVEEEEKGMTQQIQLIRKTIDNVQGELEKTKMLALGSGVNEDDLDCK